MLKKIFKCSSARAAAIFCLLAAYGSPASATLVYNYSQGWMFDSTSQLYWLNEPVSGATFVPEFGTLAAHSQIYQLVSPFNSDPIVQSGEYSQSLADFIAFFSSGMPAPAPAMTIYDYEPYSHSNDLYAGGLYNPAPAPGFEFTGFSYTQDLDNYGLPTTNWNFNGELISTVGSYMPGERWCTSGLNQGPCPATTRAFVVSSVQPPPVPLPATVWLLLSGLGIVARWSKRAVR